MMKSHSLAATVAVLSAAAAPLTGCSTDRGAQIVPAKAAEFISTEVTDKSGFTPTDINCPSGIEAKPGTEFACTFAGPSGKYAIHMKVVKVTGGDVEYEMSWRLTEPVDDGTSSTPATSTTPATDAPDDSGAPTTTPPSTDGDVPSGSATPSVPTDGGSPSTAPPGPSSGN